MVSATVVRPIIKSFEDLDVWRKAHELALEVFAMSRDFPKEERFGVTNQLRRAAASVPANIAEGFGRRTTKDFLRHLDIAGGSLDETRYFLILARDLGFLTAEKYVSLRRKADEVGKLLGALCNSLRRRLT
jgi:four helix bundle protein